MERLLAQVAPEFGDDGKVFRPNRDVRFSKDKSPYTPHCGAVIGEGRSDRGPGSASSPTRALRVWPWAGLR